MGRLQRQSSWIAFAVALVVLAPRLVHAGDIDEAKKVYGEAMKTLDAKDFTTATMKFEYAYRLAPDKHLFNYNIASSAELAGDCRKAQKHYQMFLDLVPKHDARKAAQKSLAKLAKTCAFDDETSKQLTESRDDREAERVKAMGERALDDALEATRQSVARYGAILQKHGRAQPFARVLRAKKRAVKKISKLMTQHQYEIPPERDRNDVSAPETLEQACRQGVAQEERNAAAYAKAYERVEQVEISDFMEKLELRASGSQLRSFSEGCPRR